MQARARLVRMLNMYELRQLTSLEPKMQLCEPILALLRHRLPRCLHLCRHGRLWPERVLGREPRRLRRRIWPPPRRELHAGAR